MPNNVQVSVFREIALEPSGKAKSASQGDIEAFSDTRAGKYLVDRWDNRAAQKVGLINQRIDRIGAQLNDDEFERLWNWIDSLNAEELAGVYLMLARGR